MPTKVFVAIPVHGEMKKETELTLSAFRVESVGLGIGMEEFRWVGDSLVAHARNVCVAKFLQSDCTDLFFLDADVGAGVGAYTRLLTHRVDMVAGVYRRKMDEESYPVRWKMDSERIIDPRTGLLAADAVPFGFVRISREMVQFMVDTLSDDWFYTPLLPDVKVPCLFNTEVAYRQFWGEDFYFCRRVRETGHMIWVDPDIPLRHVGDKVYEGHLGNYLRRNGELKEAA